MGNFSEALSNQMGRYLTFYLISNFDWPWKNSNPVQTWFRV